MVEAPPSPGGLKLYEDDWLEAAYEDRFDVPDENYDDLFDIGYFDSEDNEDDPFS